MNAMFLTLGLFKALKVSLGTDESISERKEYTLTSEEHPSPVEKMLLP